MPVADSLGIDEFKDMLYIFLAIPTAFVRLRAFEAVAPYHLLIDRQSCDLTDALGDLFTLVVTTLVEALLGKGNRHNSVDFIEESSGLDLFGQHTTNDSADLRTVLVFQLVDDVGCLGMRLIIEESCGALDGYLSPEEPCHLVVVGIEMEFRAR